MDLSSGRVFSNTLRDITTTKLEELSKRRQEFNDLKANIHSKLQSENDEIARLAILSAGVKQCYGVKTDKSGKVIRGHTKNPALEAELKNLDAFLVQAQYDPSVSSDAFRAWEASLRRHLDTQSLKFEYASLYAKLVTEWLPPGSETSQPGPADTREDFEDAEGSKKDESRRDWERNVFEAAQVDEPKLREYLQELFLLEAGPTKSKAKALSQLASDIATFELELSSPNQFNPTSLGWVIRGLLASDLLTDEQREVLKSFQGNDVLLFEVADVLNMRVAALQNWSWGTSVPVEQIRKISGGYNIRMHEDILQAVFLQYVGARWSVFLKGALKCFRKFGGSWIDIRENVPKIDKKRLGYYLGELASSPSIQHERRSTYRKDYFLASLLDSEYQHVEIVDGEEEAESRVSGRITKQTAMRAKRSAPGGVGGGGGGAKRHRRVERDRDPEDSETDSELDSSRQSKNPMEIKQRLLHLLSTEIALSTRVHGEITAFRCAFDSWTSSLPHSTIRTVLSFFGVSEHWVGFFSKFLEAPLRFVDDETNPARIRRRGTPASHVLSEVFGELVLFCLDYSVNQLTSGRMLYRLHDECWFWAPDHNTAVVGWSAIQSFAMATGAKLDLAKTGTVRIARDKDVSLEINENLPKGPICWGFLQLSAQSGRFEINQSMVDDHIRELRKQLLGKQASIFAFVQTWNTFATTFFTANFGRPADCWGRSHVDQMLKTHSRIQHEVFNFDSSLSGGPTGAENVVEHLKAIIEQRFGVSNIPDAFLFFPAALGGLDLRSPFISILQVRDNLVDNPMTRLDAFEEAEVVEYSRARLAFEKGDTAGARYSLEDPDWEPVEPNDRETFMSFEEFTRWRQEFDFGYDDQLLDVYRQLRRVPAPQSVEPDSGALASKISALGQQQNLSGIVGDWSKMEPYWRWVAMLYGPEVIERFGGMNIVEPGLLPTGMIGLLRDQRVKWQG